MVSNFYKQKINKIEIPLKPQIQPTNTVEPQILSKPVNWIRQKPRAYVAALRALSQEKVKSNWQHKRFSLPPLDCSKMGKRDKKPNRRRHKGEFSNDGEDFYDQHPPAAPSVVDEDEQNSEEESDELQPSSDLPSKFLLYQQSVQV